MGNANHKESINKLFSILSESDNSIKTIIKNSDFYLNQLDGNYEDIHNFQMRNYTYTILDFVVMNESVDLMKLFIEKHKINVDDEPGNGIRLLIIAIIKNNYDMLEYLLNNIDLSKINNLVEIEELFGYGEYIHVLDDKVHSIVKNNDMIELLILNGAQKRI